MAKQRRAVIPILYDSTARSVAAALACGVIAGGVEYVTHTETVRIHLPGEAAAVIDSAIISVMTAGAVYAALAAARVRRRNFLQRLRDVAVLNHNVRNALQAIVYSKYLRPEEQAEVVLDSVNRIDKTLKELFPAVVDRAKGG